jgi:hypothetical protein
MSKKYAELVKRFGQRKVDKWVQSGAIASLTGHAKPKVDAPLVTGDVVKTPEPVAVTEDAGGTSDQDEVDEVLDDALGPLDEATAKEYDEQKSELDAVDAVISRVDEAMGTCYNEGWGDGTDKCMAVFHDDGSNMIGDLNFRNRKRSMDAARTQSKKKDGSFFVLSKDGVVAEYVNGKIK